MLMNFPNESAEYREARNALLEKEYQLQQQMEQVAATRRALPTGGEVPEDYEFQRLNATGQVETVRISELFSPGKTTLAVYSFMYGPDREVPCDGCTSLLEQLESASEGFNEEIDFVVAARSPIERIGQLAELKGWTRLRFVSTSGTTYNTDYHGTDPEGYDQPILNVFRKDGDVVRHFWGAEILYAPTDSEQDPRATDPLSSLWNMLDYTPAGRGATWWPEVETPKVPILVGKD